MATRTIFQADNLLKIGGKECGFLHSVDGGGVSAAVIEEPLENVLFRKKHLGAVSYEELVIEIGLGLESAIYEWIAAWWVGIPQRRSGSVITTNSSFTPTRELAFFDALISETQISALDGSSKEAGLITVKLAPTRTENVAPAPNKVNASRPGKAKAWLSSNFRLTIDGVATGRVSRIEPLTFRRIVQAEELNGSQGVGNPTTHIEVPNLKVTFSPADLDSWQDWFNDFVLKGANADKHEKNGSIELLTNDLKDTLARIDLFNLGIFRLAREKAEAGSEKIARVTAELYCERMTFSRL